LKPQLERGLRMSVQDDKDAVQEDKDAGQDDQAGGQEESQQEKPQQVTEKPEPDEDDKKKAAEMMEAYKDKPTLVLPGTGGMVSGTAVNEWLDEDGNPKQESPDEAGAEGKAKDGKAQDDQAQDDQGKDAKAKQEQIEKDKAWNEELREAAAQENKGEK
jgi:hypothetical protein